MQVESANAQVRAFRRVIALSTVAKIAAVAAAIAIFLLAYGLYA